MNLLEHIKITFGTGLCMGVLFLAGLGLAPASKVEAHDHVHELAFKLENDLGNAVENHEIKKFSKMISKIFQGETTGGIVDRNEYILALSNTNIESFGIHNLVAKKYKSVLTVYYNVISVDTENTISDNNIVSVWQRIKNHEHHDNNSLSSQNSSDDEKWLLVSQSSIPNTRG